MLKHRPVGDYDWIVTLLTGEKGKLQAFARAARRPSTRLAGNVEPLSFGSFRLFPGKSGFIITEAKIDRYFESFRKDLEKAAYGTFFLETADYYTRENLEATEFLNLLYISLRRLEEENPEMPPSLIRCTFELRAMVNEGIFPGAPFLPAPSAGLKQMIAHIEQAPLKQLYAFSLSGELQKELWDATNRYRSHLMDYRLKSLEMIRLYEEQMS